MHSPAALIQAGRTKWTGGNRAMLWGGMHKGSWAAQGSLAADLRARAAAAARVAPADIEQVRQAPGPLQQQRCLAGVTPEILRAARGREKPEPAIRHLHDIRPLRLPDGQLHAPPACGSSTPPSRKAANCMQQRRSAPGPLRL